MKIIKKQMLVVSVFLAILLSVSWVLGGFVNAKVKVSTRQLDVSSIGMLSYEEKVEQLLDLFDDYAINVHGSQVQLEVCNDISGFDFSGIQFLSSNADTTIKRYKTSLDVENEKFYIITEYVQDGVVVYTEQIETIPQYNESLDDYLIEMPDGEIISVSETLCAESLDNCSVTVAVAGGGAAAVVGTVTTVAVVALMVVLVIVAEPVIEENVEVIKTTVVSWVKGLKKWFKSLWKKKTKTVEQTVVTTELSYSISIAQTKCLAKPYSKEMPFKNDMYYVAVADTDDNLLYVDAVNPISEMEALAILTNASYVKSAHKGSNKSFVISIYTLDSLLALNIATNAGTMIGSPGAIHHEAKKIGYFNHYHPGLQYLDELSSPHAFYGSPKA